MAGAMNAELPADTTPEAGSSRAGNRARSRGGSRIGSGAGRFNWFSPTRPRLRPARRFIFITRSLLELCERQADEIGVILGHEIGTSFTANPSTGSSQHAVFGAAPTPAGRMLDARIVGTGLKLMQSAYTQDQELDADRSGGAWPTAQGSTRARRSA